MRFLWLTFWFNQTGSLSTDRLEGSINSRYFVCPSVTGYWYLSDFHRELVPIRWEHGDRYSHGYASLVKGSPEYFIHRDSAIRRQVEEVRLYGVRRTYCDPVTITDLANVELISEVPYCSFLDVAWASEPLGSAIGQFHGVIGRLRRP